MSETVESGPVKVWWSMSWDLPRDIKVIYNDDARGRMVGNGALARPWVLIDIPSPAATH